MTKPLEVAGHEIRGRDARGRRLGARRGRARCWRPTSSARGSAAALQAIATDEASAAASGVPVATLKLRLFVLAAALAGLAGGLFTFSFQFVSPDAFPVVLSIQFVVMVAVGGLGNVYGAVAGTVAILYLEHELRELGARDELFGWTSPTPRRPSSRSASSA